MADLTITAASVIADPSARVAHGHAGVTVTAGQVVYLDPVTNTYKLADANSATAAARSPAGIALNPAAAGQTLGVAESGLVTIGATLTAGVTYYLSGTPGGIRLVADNTTGDYPSILGIAASTTVLKLKIQEAGVAL
jgi:hypothetical protein